MTRRWLLIVRDVNGRMIYSERFRTKWGALRYGRAVTSPPINWSTVERV